MLVPDDGSRALILAPAGRDAAVAAGLLAEAGMAGIVCADLASLQGRLDDDTGFVVATEEALVSADLRAIAAWTARQASWSDLPFIVLTRRGGGLEQNPSAHRLSEVLGNVTFLERPFHPTTFVSVARSALKGRRRQYQARAQMEILHESQERLRTALLAGRLGPWELDLATRELDCSRACAAVFGYERQESLTYERLVAAIYPPDRPRVEQALHRSVATGQDYEAECRNVWPDGTLHWAEMRARCLRDRHGNALRLVGVASDITARKTAEENLKRLNETLEVRVAQRTAELQRAHRTVLDEIEQRQRAEDLLRHAQKMELIGQLTGGVAHDFNNLLMAILGNLELLGKHVAKDAKAARLIDGALRGAQRGAALTQRLLAFARRQDLRTEPRDLSELVRGMADLLDRSIHPGIELRMNLPPVLPPVLVDANQIELALLNLVVNARDAMPEGGRLCITANVADTAGDDELRGGAYVRLVVEDTGHGMDAETLKKAVEPFFSTKEVGKGTGLGLSMIHGLALQLGGALRLASRPGHGARAELWLPVAAEVAVQRRPPQPDAAPAQMGGARILLVDDDSLVSMSTAGLLEDLGHEVIEAGSGPQALEILKSGQTVDLVITDYSMPKMNGVQFAKAAQDLRPGLPILLATGYADLPPGTGIGLPRLGKPYRQEQLSEEIAKILK